VSITAVAECQVCVYYCRTYYKVLCGGARGMLCERRVARIRGAREGACEEKCEPNPKTQTRTKLRRCVFMFIT
jgi:hypothetical protein